jgi:hypothetical protein
VGRNNQRNWRILGNSVNAADSEGDTVLCESGVCNSPVRRTDCACCYDHVERDDKSV